MCDDLPWYSDIEWFDTFKAPKPLKPAIRFSDQKVDFTIHTNMDKNYVKSININPIVHVVRPKYYQPEWGTDLTDYHIVIRSLLFLVRFFKI